MSQEIPGQEDHPRITWAGTPVSYLRRSMAGFVEGLYLKGPEGYRWDPDHNTTQIVVSSTVPVDATSFGQRPCIAIARTGFIWPGAGIGAIDQIEPRTGALVKSDLAGGTFLIHHISGKEAEAEDLAAYTLEMIWMLFDLLNKVHIQIQNQLTLGEPANAASLVAGDVKGLVTVPVIVPFRFARTCRREPLGQPILKSITMRIAARNPAAFPDVVQPVYPRPAGDDPANISTSLRTVSGAASQASDPVRSSTKIQED